MRRILPVLLALFAVAIPARAQQTQTKVTGTITDPNNVAYYPATVLACLTPATTNPTVAGASVSTNIGQPYCVGPAQTSSSGIFQLPLYANSVISCNNVACSTQWQFTVTAAGTAPPAGKGTVSFQVTTSITNLTAQDVTAILVTAAPVLLNSGGGGGAVGPGTPTYVSCFNTTTNVNNCPDSITDSGGTVTIPAQVVIGGGAGAASVAYPSGATSGCQTATAGVNILCSDGTNNTFDESLNGGPLAPLGTTQGIYDASTITASDWGVAANTMMTAHPNATIIVPDSIAGTSSVTINVGANNTLVFTGNGTFTFCTMTMSTYSKAISDFGAQLKESGSSCPGIEWIGSSPSLQSTDHPMLRGLRINCNSQTTSTGLTVNPATGGGASFDFENIEIIGCTTVGAIANQMQFSHWRNVHIQQNYVNLKLYSGTGGGVSSNIFDGLALGSPSSGVNAIVYNTATAQVQTGNTFINPQFQGGGVVSLAVIGASGATQPTVTLIGGSPELNGPSGTSPASSITIDGNVITQAGAGFLNNAIVTWNQPDIEDGAASPEFLATNSSTVTLRDLHGYGNSGGNLCQVDSTSFCNMPGTVSAIGLAQGLNYYPQSLSSVGSTGFKMIGAPNIFYTNQMPNMLNNANGSAMYAPYSAFGTGASGTSCLDTLYGTVNCMSFAASSGTDCSANCVSFGNLLSSALGSSNDIFVSFIAKAATAGSFQFYGGGANFSAIVATVPTTWTRYIVYLPNQASSTNFTFHIIPKDSTGTTLYMTGLEIVQYAAQSQTSQQYISLALTGATGTALTKVPTISSGFGTSPSVVNYEWLSPSELVFTVNVGTGGTASSGVIGLAQPPTGFNCTADDITHPTTGGGFYVKPTATSNIPFTITLTGYNTSGSATAWTASDILQVKCSVY